MLTSTLTRLSSDNHDVSSDNQALQSENEALRSDVEVLQRSLADLRKTSTPAKWNVQLRGRLDEQHVELQKIRKGYQALQSENRALQVRGRNSSPNTPRLSTCIHPLTRPPARPTFPTLRK